MLLKQLTVAVNFDKIMKEPIKQLTETEKAYIAGFLDADGCVGISRNKSRSKAYEWDYALRVMIINSDFEFIKWLKEKTGIGTAYESKKAFKPNWSPVHRWQATADKGRQILEQLLPYLIVKKYRSEMCLKLPKTKNCKCGRTLEQYQEQETLFYQLKKLNKRGLKDY